MTFASALYEGRVVHTRHRPRAHRLSYSVFSMLIDLDELPVLDRGMPFFGYNRSAPISFFDRDHGPADGGSLKAWAMDRLKDAGIDFDGGPILLLCYPRIAGYVFNPLSVYFCYRRSGELAAILYEVCNTFKERHTYVIPVSSDRQGSVRQTCDKALYVSPFIGMEATYRFRITPPGEAIGIHIRQEDAAGPFLYAGFAGKRRALTKWSAVGLLARFPFMTVKIMAAIHWEALKLWLKGMPVFAHVPAASPVQASFQQKPTNGV
ncbi:DUF1365 domain-containing protein [Rhodospirillaceae bacterium KN72]|uniref:DUF1365 domain-containing protein n=1 Tax=Pacificispira spongiicola TaxID=2729598 RepID=A0A7Y0HFK3_9PROT|nr:DUF1365 domain-containing protein [Pacificispira spongiicola]NMM43359.1 DUF1365 domain-containing protein [Pacificispira spongiicola]